MSDNASCCSWSFLHKTSFCARANSDHRSHCHWQSSIRRTKMLSKRAAGCICFCLLLLLLLLLIDPAWTGKSEVTIISFTLRFDHPSLFPHSLTHSDLSCDGEKKRVCVTFQRRTKLITFWAFGWNENFDNCEVSMRVSVCVCVCWLSIVHSFVRSPASVPQCHVAGEWNHLRESKYLWYRVR